MEISSTKRKINQIKNQKIVANKRKNKVKSIDQMLMRKKNKKIN